MGRPTRQNPPNHAHSLSHGVWKAFPGLRLVLRPAKSVDIAPMGSVSALVGFALRANVCVCVFRLEAVASRKALQTDRSL